MKPLKQLLQEKAKEYPWTGMELTQVEGSYELHVALTKDFSVNAYLDDKGLAYLERTIKNIRTHQKWVKAQTEKTGVC